MESKSYAAIKEGERYVLLVSPEPDSGIEVMKVPVDACWVRSSENSFTVGFALAGPSKASMEQYISYLKKHS
jgi:hypothetical protein